MNLKAKKGLFVSIEGPNGVGKTTLVDAIAKRLSSLGCDVKKTREPTESALGSWIRANQGKVRGKALACLLTADRFQHIQSIIEPSLVRNGVVITDRYLASSYVYQVSDGVSQDYISALNSECLVPDLTVLLLANPSTIGARLNRRSDLTRFERSISPDTEIALYRHACKLLGRRGWRIDVFKNEDGLTDEIAATVTQSLITMRE